jgi:peroxiredoxin
MSDAFASLARRSSPLGRRAFSSALAALPLAAVLPGTAQAAAAAVGQAAPDFSATDTAGKIHKLSDFKGKLVVLEWTNPGCPFVQKHYGGNMQTLQKEITGKGVVWLAINSTEPESADYQAPAKLAGWIKEKGAAPTATLMDEPGKIGQLYGAKTTPHLYIVDTQGRLAYAGAIDSIPSARESDIKTATNYVRQSVGELLAGKPVSQPSTRAYGCSVKYKSA